MVRHKSLIASIEKAAATIRPCLQFVWDNSGEHFPRQQSAAVLQVHIDAFCLDLPVCSPGAVSPPRLTGTVTASRYGGSSTFSANLP